MKPESGRVYASLSPSLSRVVDRSFDRVSMPPFASRPSLTPVLARARQSHPITCNSFITRARRAVLAGIDRLDGPARAPFHIHTQTPIDRSNKKKQSRNTRTTKKKQRTGQVAPSPRAPPRPVPARAPPRPVDRSRANRPRARGRRRLVLATRARVSSATRSVGRRVRWTRAMEDAREWMHGAREWMHGARERRARCERARNGSRGAKG